MGVPQTFNTTHIQPSGTYRCREPAFRQQQSATVGFGDTQMTPTYRRGAL